MNTILELSSKSTKGGRRKIKMVLLTIHSNPKDKNLNGINWKEEYILDNLESIKGIPICASFLTEEKDIPSGHGYTETVELGDGKSEPLFNNSECCGVIEKAQIEEIVINNETKKVLVGYGYIFYQRYKNFYDYIEEHIQNAEVKSSIEIVGKNGGSIVYEGGYNEDLRYPQIFDFSATAILGNIKEADENCYVLEVAQKQKKEEDLEMDENKIVEVIQKTIKECNSVKSDFEAKIGELNTSLSAKETEITELNEKLTEAETNAQDVTNELEALKLENENLKKELVACKKKELNAALDEKLSIYTDEQKECVKTEINTYKENPVDGDAEAIISKICVNIVSKQMAEQKNAEQNSANDNADLDIFSDIETNPSGNEDINIF